MGGVIIEESELKIASEDIMKKAAKVALALFGAALVLGVAACSNASGGGGNTTAPTTLTTPTTPTGGGTGTDNGEGQQTGGGKRQRTNDRYG